MENSKESTTVRQNSEYTSSRKLEANLRRNPTLHFQIGLILALLASIFFIEMRTPERAVAFKESPENIDQIFTIDQVRVESKEVVVQKKIELPKQQEPKNLDNIQEKDDYAIDFIEDSLKTSEPNDEPMVEPTSIPFEEPIEDIAPMLLNFVESVPLFPGCEGLSTNDERRDCMSAKISKFVTKKFRSEQGEGLGLTGVNRIFVTFKINKQGNVVDVQAKARHSKLEEEAKRVTQLLPKMTAGKQGGKDVAVLFSLPILFQIQD